MYFFFNNFKYRNNSTITVVNTCPVITTGAKRYTITFDTNGGKEIENISEAMMQNENPTEKKLDLPTPIKDGYKFVGCYKDKELNNKANIESYDDIINLENINEDECSTELIVKLYAKWDKTVENPKTGVAEYTSLGILTIITLSGTYMLYKNKI